MKQFFILASIFFVLSNSYASECKEVRNILMCKKILECKGSTAYGGPCYKGYGGPLYSGFGGNCYSGYGGPLFDGYSGPLFAGYDGDCFRGYGGNCSVCSLDIDKCPTKCLTVCPVTPDSKYYYEERCL